MLFSSIWVVIVKSNNGQITGWMNRRVKGWWCKLWPMNTITWLGYASNISRMSSSSRDLIHTRLMQWATMRNAWCIITYNLDNSIAEHNVRTLSVFVKNVCISCCFFISSRAKMILQFGELGWDSSIFTCNGSVNSPSDGTSEKKY
jgi:hypothetical protein